MKLSNKVLVGFLGFIFIYLTAAFAELRLTGTPNVIDDKNSIAETANISGVSCVILNDVDKDISITGSDSARLEVRSLAGDWLTRLKYKVSGDTLTLSGLQSKDTRSIKISVFVPKTSLRAISVNHSVAIVKGLQRELFNISQNSGRLFMSDNKITRISIDLSNRSYLDISAMRLDTLSAQIEGSEVQLSAPVGVLQGSMENNAHLRAGDIREIQLRKDDGSRLNIQ